LAFVGARPWRANVIVRFGLCSGAITIAQM